MAHGAGKGVLEILLAAPDCAAAYRAETLSAADRERLNRRPQTAARTDWQVSRFLRAQAGADGCISHSGGCAAWAPQGAGVDIETLRPRRFAGHGWVYRADEREWLRLRGGTAADYYVLWTLKEALLKAAGREWADLGHVGLRRTGQDWQLHDGADGIWHGCAVLVDGSHIAACVWPPPLAQTVRWRGFGAWEHVPVREQAVFR